MFKNIKGVITFEAVAPDSDYFINILKKSCVTSSNLRYKNGKIIGNIYSNDFGELKKVGSICNAQISVLERKGFIFVITKYKKRFGLIIGLIMAIIMVVYLSNIVMIIEIYGNESIPDSKILSLLNDVGIHIGASISDIDFRDAERRIVSSSEDISWTGIRSSGSKIQIEIYEMDNSPEILQKNIPCNIVASKDAQIVDIKNVYSGMLMQMLKSGVKKGDILISGTVEDGKGGVYYTHSIGEIIGRFSETVTFSQPYDDSEIHFEEPVIRKSIHFFGMRIPLYMTANTYSQYELEENVSYLKLFDMQLPIGIISSEYRPYTIQSCMYSREEAEAILVNKIELYEYNFLKNDNVMIIGKKVEFAETNNSLKSIVQYELEGNIGISKEIMVK